MNLSFPPPPSGPFGAYVGRVLDTLRRAFLTVVSYNTEVPRVILQSPAGKNWALTVADNGALTITNAVQQIKGTLNTVAQAVLPFLANTFKLVDATDNTKAVQLDVSGVSTATTRTLTVPDASGVIALTSNIPVVPAAFGSIKVTKFTSSGTFTPDAKCLCGYAVAKGSGAGSANLTVDPSLSYGGGGGGEGATAIKFFSAADVAGGVAVTVAAGGGGSANGSSSSFGTLAVAVGGATSGIVGGAGGLASACTGDICIGGASGGSGLVAAAAQADGTPGNGGGAGGGVGIDSSGTEFHQGGSGQPNTGGGAGGSSSRSSGPGSVPGGVGGSGFVYVVEYLKA